MPTLEDNFLNQINQIIDHSKQREQTYICSNVSWDEYEKILETLRDVSWCKISYLDGVMTIMSPSENHELAKEHIGILLEVYCDEAEIDYYPLGSKTLKQKDKSSGKEPDASYCIGKKTQIPDIAIEIIVTSGGIEDLEKYKKLDVKEVWFWKTDGLEIYSMDNNQYTKNERSTILPQLDIKLLTEYIKKMTKGNPRKLKKEFAEQIRNQLLINKNNPFS